MKKSIRIALVLILAGALITGIAFACVGFRPVGFSTVRTVEQHFEITGPVNELLISDNCPEVRYECSPDDTLSVHAVVNEKTPLSVTVSEGVLAIAPENEQKWFNSIVEFDLSDQSVVIELPQALYREFVGDPSCPDAPGI